MKTQHTSRLTVASLAMISLAGSALSQSVTISNAGFEDPGLGDGSASFAAPFTGWDLVNEGGAQIGILNPGAGDLSAGAPEGQNVGVVSGTTGEGGFSQTLGGATGQFQDGADYSLTVQVANTLFTAGFPGYRVQLLAGGSVLAEDDNTLPVAEDAVVGVTVNYTYSAGDAGLVGQPLEIRLLGKGGADEVAFDDVALAATLSNPLANAGGPYSVGAGGTLVLDGSGSLPSSGASITLYEWDLNNDGTFGDTVGVSPAGIPEADLFGVWGMTSGANTIALRVTDDGAGTTPSVATTTVTVGTTVFTTVANGDDSWNDVTNWDNGVPTGTLSAILTAGNTAQVNNNATPPYSGTLLMEAGSTLRFNESGTGNNIGKFNALAAGGITMEDNTEINTATQADPTFPDLVLNGATRFLSGNNAGDRDTRIFGGAISGTGSLTITGRNVEKWIFTETNTFTGGLTLAAVDRYIVRAQAAGALGAGDVTVTPRSNADRRSASISIEAADAIADTATLSLSGNGPDNTTGADDFSSTSVLIRMGADDTVNELFVEGVQAAAGAYTDASGDWIDGTGTLTVLSGPPTGTPPTVTSIDDIFNGGPIFSDVTEIVYTVNFSEPLDGTSVDLTDFELTGTATGTITSVTVVSGAVDLGRVEVVVEPTSAGDLTLQIKAGTTILDAVGDALDTTSAIADDPITINAGASPALVITGTASAPDAWNDASNWDLNVVPIGPYGAVIDGGLIATVENANTPVYSGGLTFLAGSELDVRNVQGSENAIGTGTVTFNTGSILRLRSGGDPVTIPGDIVFVGDATITNSSNSTDNEIRNLSGNISGPGLFTLEVRRGNTVNITGTNTWTGGFVFNYVDNNFNNGSRVVPGDSGFGTGDVTINDGLQLWIPSGRTDVIDDSAALSLNGRGRRNGSDDRKLRLQSDETVNELWLDNTAGDGSASVQLAAGDYTATSSPGGGPALLSSAGLPLITGSGTLTVLSGPGGGGNNFSDWIAGFPGAAGDTTFGGDPDGDGLGSGLENFFGTNPGEFNEGLVVSGVDTGAGTFTFTHPQNAAPADDVSGAAYTWSTDLQTFTADGVADGGTTVSFVATPDTPVAGTTTVVATVTGTPVTELFVQVGVTQLP